MDELTGRHVPNAGALPPPEIGLKIKAMVGLPVTEG